MCVLQVSPSLAGAAKVAVPGTKGGGGLEENAAMGDAIVQKLQKGLCGMNGVIAASIW